ncbi:hypothetical protein L6164_013102 [Bauhinia variegata]|uniref:Uncharacterized protein n=1 Tax=Bauhinia variegata TaxID=167791 RepID=A0ACB9PB17_BAUVA|nr:hypothetical protein L6164_013102 [Bauhinia variegata]
MILAAFALDYGELWLHFQNFKVESQFLRSFGFLRHANDFNRRLANESSKKAMVDLNDLVKGTLKLIQCILDRRNKDYLRVL